MAAIIHWWSSTALPPALLVRPLVIVLVVALLITAVATLIVRDRNVAGIAAWAVLTGATVNDVRAFALLLVVAAAVMAIGIRMRQVVWPRGPIVTRFLSILAVILLLTSLIDSVQSGAAGYAFDDIRRDLSADDPAETFTPGRPDIYVLLLDGFPGHTAAMTESDFDAAAWTEALETRGFDVALDSRSNYITTRLTLPSVFASAHLPDVPTLSQPGSRQRDAHVLREATESSVVLSALGAAGYERIAIASGLLASFADPIRDPEIRRQRFFEFSAYIANRTVTAVDAILAASRTRPVIVLFSDHGPDISFDTHDPLAFDLDDRTSNLIAVLAPGRAGLLPDDATTVNIFPFVLNAYLETDLPIQPNTFWAWRTGSSILDFVELDPRTWKAK